jgi:hypothetical protein
VIDLVSLERKKEDILTASFTCFVTKSILLKLSFSNFLNLSEPVFILSDRATHKDAQDRGHNLKLQTQPTARPPLALNRDANDQAKVKGHGCEIRVHLAGARNNTTCPPLLRAISIKEGSTWS